MCMLKLPIPGLLATPQPSHLKAFLVVIKLACYDFDLFTQTILWKHKISLSSNGYLKYTVPNTKYIVTNTKCTIPNTKKLWCLLFLDVADIFSWRQQFRHFRESGRLARARFYWIPIPFHSGGSQVDGCPLLYGCPRVDGWPSGGMQSFWGEAFTWMHNSTLNPTVPLRFKDTSPEANPSDTDPLSLKVKWKWNESEIKVKVKI